MTVPWRKVLGVILEKINFSSKMSLSKQKNCITNWFTKDEIEKEKKIEEERLLTMPENEWCHFLMKSPDNFYSGVDGNFELWVILGSFTHNVWDFSFDTFAKDFNCLCWIKITCLSATKYNVIFFYIFQFVECSGQNNISAEICQLLQKKMSQYSME